MNGFYRIATLTPDVHLANPTANAEAILTVAMAAIEEGASILVAPELAITGATCGDLYLQQALMRETQDALELLAERLPEHVVLICGAPYYWQGACYDCAAILTHEGVYGYVPRTQWLRKDTSRRCFTATSSLPTEAIGPLLAPNTSFIIDELSVAITFGLQPLPAEQPKPALVIALDAAPEGCGHSTARRTALSYLSTLTDSTWVYASAGMGESSTDGVYSGHRMIAQEGKLLCEAQWETGFSLVDVQPEWHQMRQMRTAPQQSFSVPHYQRIEITLMPSDGTAAYLRKAPFIPETLPERQTRCREILQLQVQGLWRRFQQVRAKRLILGLSGGLDSTLALIVCKQLCQQYHLPSDTLLAVTMPGFGTSDRTYQNACTLAKTVGAELREISIVPCVEQHFKDIGHDPADHSVTYENAQARARTYLLMDIANKEGGLLVGTGDLSEIALGWSTYNGDHMSMYSVNCTVPKTLIPHCLETAAQDLTAEDASIGEVLHTVLKDICDTPVSPELIPGKQHTESIVGRYELHDCFLWYFMRYGCNREQLHELADLLFPEIAESERERTLDIFCKRVITQQFKRSCSPDGPAIGGITLSPRGGWMLPSDAQLPL